MRHLDGFKHFRKFLDCFVNLDDFDLVPFNIYKLMLSSQKMVNRVSCPALNIAIR
jgi:hypothetical protein